MTSKKPPKVLVVDDEGVIRDFLTRFFVFEGVEVRTADDGLKAIEMARKEHFDIVFLDMRMPKINGAETYKELRKVSPKSKYVMMTGYSLDDLLKNMEGEDIEAVITKPFEIKEIISILEDYERQRYPKEIADVLIVETEDVVRKFFTQLFQNYNVTGVKTGREALEMILQRDFDVIIADMALEDITGVELYAKIQEIRPHARIILVTGDAEKTKGLVRDALYMQIKNIFNK